MRKTDTFRESIPDKELHDESAIRQSLSTNAEPASISQQVDAARVGMAKYRTALHALAT